MDLSASASDQVLLTPALEHALSTAQHYIATKNCIKVWLGEYGRVHIMIYVSFDRDTPERSTRNISSNPRP